MGKVPTWLRRPGAGGTSQPGPTPAVCTIGDIHVRVPRVLEREAAPRWWGPRSRGQRADPCHCPRPPPHLRSTASRSLTLWDCTF